MAISDTRSAGRSRRVPFIAGEDSGARHARRLGANLEEGRPALDAWCAERGATLEVKNGGHHWIFKLGDRIVEWWPSSAKLVAGRRYNRGVHVHDWEQARRLLDRHLVRR